MDKNELIKQYKEKFGKNPFGGWNEEELTKRLQEPAQETDLITVSKSELERMIEDATKKAMEFKPEKSFNNNEWKEYKEIAGTNKKATLKIYKPSIDDESAVVVAVDYNKTAWNEEEHKFNKVLYRVKLLFDDGSTKDIDMTAQEYAAINNIETVELIDVDRKVLERKTGKTVLNLPNDKGVIVRSANSGGYGVVMGGEYEVDLSEYKVHEVFTVRRDNGKTFKMEAKYLNN